MLKKKIISRPDRQLLIEHNILSDTIAAPAIQKTQRQLQSAKLADNLNDKIAARPGVLDLVAKNILEIDSNLKEAIQGGRIPFPSAKRNSSIVLDGSGPSSSEELLTTSISSYSHQQRPLRPKTSSASNLINGQTNPNSKRPVNSKMKSSLTFHEYKGPSQKVEVTKVPLQLTRSLIVQPVQATLVPLVPLEAHSTLSDTQYRIQLQQQKLFLELQNTNSSNTVKFVDVDQTNDGSSDHDQDDNPIGNLLKQPIDESVHILPNISDEIRSFEKMKLADLKHRCRKLNLSTTGTKTKLIEKLRNAAVKMSGKTKKISFSIR